MHTGSFIGFSLPSSVASFYALPDGLPASELHLTLIFLGDVKEISREKLYKLRMELSLFCVEREKIVGEITGAGRFWSKNSTDASVLLFTSTILNSLRIEILSICHKVGIFPPENYGFIPHITLGYFPRDNPIILHKNSPRNICFNGLEVWYSGEKTNIPFKVQ